MTAARRFVSGDHPELNTEVAVLFRGAGFFTIDLGPLRDGGRLQQFQGLLSGVNLDRLP